MKKVLSVGAGVEQVTSIQIALNLGLEVIAIDRDPNAVGFSIATKAFSIDIADENEAIKIAQMSGIQAIIPAPIGRYLTTVGAVNDALRLRGISKQAALRCTDKNLFQSAMEQAGVYRPKQLLVTDKAILSDALVAFGFPCIIKPRNGSGSRGIVTVHNQSQVQSAVNEHLEHNTHDDILIEEFIDGPEYGVDGVVIDGKFHLVMIRGKELTPLPYRQAVGMFSQWCLDTPLQEEITSQLAMCVTAIGMNNCLLHADVILNPENKAFIVEIAGRPAGLNISSMLIPYAIGVPFLEEGINLVLQQNPDFTPKWFRPFAFRFMNQDGSESERDGVIQQYPDIIDLRFSNCPVNNDEDKITCGADVMKGGFLLTTGHDVSDAISNNNQILARIRMRNKNDE